MDNSACVDWDKLCAAYGLGALLASPAPVSGGYLHRMFRVNTTCGEYAVKLLNPLIMAREDAHENFRLAEALEGKLEAAGVPIVPAMRKNGRKLLRLDGQEFYLFAWFDGCALAPGDITRMHCDAMGRALARIHQIEKRAANDARCDCPVAWDAYAPLLDPSERAMLARLSREATAAPPAKWLTICHNDMDYKNVLWHNSTYRIIDLECLSYADPGVELLETALYWSGIELVNLQTPLLNAFVHAYLYAGGQVTDDWETLFARSTARLSWLEYCLARAAGGDEQGIAQARHTLRQLKHIDAHRDQIINALRC